MRELLLNNGQAIVWGVVIVEVVLLLLLLRQYGDSHDPISLLATLVDLGLIYDALIIALGNGLPVGLLEGLSRFRFVFHGLLVPLLLPISAHATKMNKPLKILVYIITAVVIAGGIWMGFSCKLEMQELAGLRRFISSKETSSLAQIIENVLSFGTVIPLIIAGIYVTIKQKNPHILLSGLFMFAFSALGPATGNVDLIFLISMFGEILMIFFIYLYVQKEEE